MSDILDMIRSRCVEEGQCWVWSGGSRKVPHLNTDGEKTSVRLLVLLANGKKVPVGHVPGVTCGTFKCVSPECVVARSRVEHAQHHASLGAYSAPAKTAKMAATKRARSKKLNDAKVLAIRASTKTHKQIAEEFDIPASYVGSIRRGELWRDHSNPFAGLGSRAAA